MDAMGPLQDIRETWARFLNDENAAWVFVRTRRLAILAVSLVVLVPCFWHKRIEAGDLGSHVYNAWLAQLIAKGQAPGLYIATQWNNVLFDVSLLHVANEIGFAAAQKVVVSASVLIFFWGVFAFISALTGHAPWVLTPCILMLSYGYAFNMGFMNYYLSAGLGCFALALLYEGKGMAWVGGGVLAGLALVAHPIGFLWTLCMAAYLLLWRRIPEYWRLALALACLAVFAALRWKLENNTAYEADWLPGLFLARNGADQLVLYGQRYWYVYAIALAWGIVALGSALWLTIQAKKTNWAALRLSLEFYLVSMGVTALLPENLRSSMYAGWIGLLVSRLTLITAVFSLAVLASVPMRRWMSAGFVACAVLFFTFLYQDTGQLNELEANAEKITAALPYGTRIVPIINAPGDWRVQFIAHSVERACINHCFSVSNYEPSSGQFRIRVLGASPMVTASALVSEDMASGEYVVKEGDLPLLAIRQCGAELTKLCVGTLSAGEKTEDSDDPD